MELIHKFIKKRANILLNFMSKSIDEISDGLIILNAACTANFLIQKIFETYLTYKEENECPQCVNHIVKNSTTFTANLPTGNIYFMLDIIENVFGTERKCKQCNSVFKTNFTFRKHFFIEPIFQSLELGKKIRL
jgi:hypothetical protein